jgi:hypothetical protein
MMQPNARAGTRPDDPAQVFQQAPSDGSTTSDYIDCPIAPSTVPIAAKDRRRSTMIRDARCTHSGMALLALPCLIACGRIGYGSSGIMTSSADGGGDGSTGARDSGVRTDPDADPAALDAGPLAGDGPWLLWTSEDDGGAIQSTELTGANPTTCFPGSEPWTAWRWTPPPALSIGPAAT